MAHLKFKSDTHPLWAEDVHVDTADVLAVRNLGFIAMSKGTYAHRRQVYTHDALTTVWEIAASPTAPAGIATLDTLGGKARISAARIDSHGSGNRPALTGATQIVISTEKADLEVIKIAEGHKSRLCSTGVSSVFTDNGVARTIPDKTLMNYAALNIGSHSRVPVAHLNENKFSAFKVA